jgi:hypothetical protein
MLFELQYFPTLGDVASLTSELDLVLSQVGSGSGENDLR